MFTVSAKNQGSRYLVFAEDICNLEIAPILPIDRKHAANALTNT
jgi:hypothetical protein